MNKRFSIIITFIPNELLWLFICFPARPPFYAPLSSIISSYLWILVRVIWCFGSSTGVVKNYDSVYVMANAYVESGTRIAKSSQSGLNLLLLTIASVRLINKRLAPHCCLHRPMNLIFPVRHLSKSASGIHFNLPPPPMPAYLSREDKKDFSAFYEATLCRRYAAMPLIIKANVGYTFPHPPALDAPHAV